MSQSHHSNEVDERTWRIARPENADKVWYGLVTVCVILIMTDFVYHGFFHDKHGYFVFETAVAFHALYGFGAFVFVVLLGKELRKLIMRPENYYTVEPLANIEDDHHDDHHEEQQNHGDSHE